MQKLKMSFFHLLESLFTCFLKDKTLHNHWDYAGFTVPYYNIPSNNRELQPLAICLANRMDYNIPSNNRELQQCRAPWLHPADYNIPSNNRELQPMADTSEAPYYYNIPSNNRELQHLEPEEKPPSHYNIPSNNRELQQLLHLMHVTLIITYQVITGNYSMPAHFTL